MKQRCFNPKHSGFKNYGNKSITICDEWYNSFEKFRDWALVNGYQEGLTIDRINNKGNYEPSNCQWLTRSENSKKVVHNPPDTSLINERFGSIVIIDRIAVKGKKAQWVYKCDCGEIGMVCTAELHRRGSVKCCRKCKNKAFGELHRRNT
jgi:hypothetical protein